MIDWNRDITWPEGEYNPPDPWVPGYAIHRFVEHLRCAPERVEEAQRKRPKPYDGIPAAPLAKRICEEMRKSNLSIGQVCRQVNEIAGRRLGNETVRNLIAEKYPVISHSTAQAVEAWLYSKENTEALNVAGCEDEH